MPIKVKTPAQAQRRSEVLLKFRRVTIRGAQPSARLSEEICLSEGSAGISERALRGLSEGSAGSLRGSAGVFEGSDPMLVTLGNCWRSTKLSVHRIAFPDPPQSEECRIWALSTDFTMFRALFGGGPTGRFASRS